MQPGTLDGQFAEDRMAKSRPVLIQPGKNAFQLIQNARLLRAQPEPNPLPFEVARRNCDRAWVKTGHLAPVQLELSVAHDQGDRAAIDRYHAAEELVAVGQPHFVLVGETRRAPGFGNRTSKADRMEHDRRSAL